MQLADWQVDILFLEIQKRGVYSSDLQEDLLDHICCLVEDEMLHISDFKTAYLNVLRNFGPLRLVQFKTEQVIGASGRWAFFYRFMDYLFTFTYIIIGVFSFIVPFFLLATVKDKSVFFLFSPTLIFGYVVCFTRIDYKKFNMIPFN